MSINPEQFDETKLSVAKPVPGEEAGNKFATCTILYDGKPFNYYLTDAVNMTRINENPQKAGQYSQGIRLETEALKKMMLRANQVLFEKLLEHRTDPNMPAFMRNLNNVEAVMQAKKFGTKVKGLVHFTEKKDSKGVATGEIDESLVPLTYGKLIQSGPKHKDKPNQCFTKYWSAAILNPENDFMIKKGKVKEASFAFNPLDIFKSKTGMKGMPAGGVSDFYIATGSIIMRSFISEVYITEFVSGESEVKKNLKTHLMREGKSNISGPTALPGVVAEEDVDETINEEGGPMPSGVSVQDVSFGSDAGFTVKVSQ